MRRNQHPVCSHRTLNCLVTHLKGHMNIVAWPTWVLLIWLSTLTSHSKYGVVIKTSRHVCLYFSNLLQLLLCHIHTIHLSTALFSFHLFWSHSISMTTLVPVKELSRQHTDSMFSQCMSRPGPACLPHLSKVICFSTYGLRGLARGLLHKPSSLLSRLEAIFYYLFWGRMPWQCTNSVAPERVTRSAVVVPVNGPAYPSHSASSAIAQRTNLFCLPSGIYHEHCCLTWLGPIHLGWARLLFACLVCSTLCCVGTERWANT